MSGLMLLLMMKNKDLRETSDRCKRQMTDFDGRSQQNTDIDYIIVYLCDRWSVYAGCENLQTSKSRDKRAWTAFMYR